MPQAVAVAIGTAKAIGVALGFAGTMATIVGAVLVVGTVALATKAIRKNIAKRQQAQQASISGILLTKTGTTAPIPVVYGERRIAGHRNFIGSEGDKNLYLHIVETLCEGPIEGLTKIYFNDEEVATSSDNGATWDWTGASYDTFVEVAFKDGSQTAKITGTVLGRSIHSNWPAGAVGNNVAYTYFVMKFDQDKFGSGVPNITYLVKGKKVPAIGSAQNTTLSYTQEPARIIHDFLTNELYGKGIPVSLIDSTSFNASATYNNEQVDKTASDSTQVTRYKCNAFLDTTTSMLENLEELLTTCRAGLITSDKYKLIQDKPTTPTSVTINDDNIIGNINYVQANKKTLMNGIRCKFPNASSDFNFQEDITIVESATLQGSSKDGVKLVKDIQLSNTTNKEMVDRILTEEVNQSRQSGVMEVQVDASLIDLEVGDVVKFTNDTLGQTDKLYRITSTVLSSDHTITLNMREYDTDVYWDNNQTIITDNKDDTDH